MEDIRVEPQTVDEARNAVERSRQRMSSTLDALEDRIVEKKHELQERVDVLRPLKEQVRQRPFTSVAVAVGVGALLGSIGGDDDDDRDVRRSRSGRVRDLDDDARRELRAWRKERNERVRKLRSRSDRDHQRDGGSRMDNVRAQLMGAVTAAISTAISSRVRELARGTLGGSSGRHGARGDDRYGDR